MEQEGNTIFIRRHKDRDYTVMDNFFLRDDTLSWKAKGLFAYILSLPDTWKIYQEELIKHSSDGLVSFRSGIKELKEHGYLTMVKKSENGTFIYVYSVHEHPYEDEEEQIEQKKEEPKKVPLLEREPKNDIEKVEKVYLENYQNLYKKKIVKTEKPIINWQQSRKLLKTAIGNYGLDVILDAVKNSINSDFIVGGGYCLTTILSANVLNGLVNGNKGVSASSKTGFKTGQGIDEYKDDGFLF